MEIFVSGETTEKRSTVGLVAAGAFALSGLTLLGLSIPFVAPAFRKICIPFVPATDKQIANVLQALSGRKGRLIDLGSGDGRIVLKTAEKGFRATGVELNSILVLYSKIKAKLNGLSSLATFRRQNLWDIDLSEFENVVIFGVNEMMPQLERKIFNELRLNKDYRVIACRFPLQNTEPLKIIGIGIDTVWVYKF